MNGAHNGIFFGPPPPWGPREGSKGQISFNFNNKVNFRDFYTKNTKFVLTNERYKTYQTRFFILSPGSCPEGSGVIKTFFKHGHVALQIDGDDEQNRMQVKFSSYGQTGDLGVRSKGQISLNFD